VRLALKLSEQEAAQAMRITVKTYRKWEAGSRMHGGTAHIISFCKEGGFGHPAVDSA
jgi:DNA-binding transcriptional regulator YiaG